MKDKNLRKFVGYDPYKKSTADRLKYIERRNELLLEEISIIRYQLEALTDYLNVEFRFQKDHPIVEIVKKGENEENA